MPDDKTGAGLGNPPTLIPQLNSRVARQVVSPPVVNPPPPQQHVFMSGGIPIPPQHYVPQNFVRPPVFQTQQSPTPSAGPANFAKTCMFQLQPQPQVPQAPHHQAVPQPYFAKNYMFQAPPPQAPQAPQAPANFTKTCMFQLQPPPSPAPSAAPANFAKTCMFQLQPPPSPVQPPPVNQPNFTRTCMFQLQPPPPPPIAQPQQMPPSNFTKTCMFQLQPPPAPVPPPMASPTNFAKTCMFQVQPQANAHFAQPPIASPVAPSNFTKTCMFQLQPPHQPPPPITPPNFVQPFKFPAPTPAAPQQMPLLPFGNAQPQAPAAFGGPVTPTNSTDDYFNSPLAVTPGTPLQPTTPKQMTTTPPPAKSPMTPKAGLGGRLKTIMRDVITRNDGQNPVPDYGKLDAAEQSKEQKGGWRNRLGNLLHYQLDDEEEEVDLVDADTTTTEDDGISIPKKRRKSREPRTPRKRDGKEGEAFQAHIMTTGVNGLAAEFKVLPTQVVPEENVAFRANVKKNRYKNVPCLDATRVKLQGPNEYIHANFVNSGSNPKRFICTQGPLPTTSADFWRMVVQENVEYIIMLCNCMENNAKKCEEYFPTVQNKVKTYDDITITLRKSLDSTCFDTKQLTVSQYKLKTSLGTRRVTHYRWLDWPDKGVPPSGVTPFRLYHQIAKVTTPIVVHCSAGVGRTGTIVALFIILDHIEHGEPCPNTMDVAYRLRMQRHSAIQKPNQYLYLNRILFDHFERMKSAAAAQDPGRVFKLQKFTTEYEQFMIQNP